MRRTLGVALAVMTLAIPSAAASAFDGTVQGNLESFHGNPLTCDQALGPVPAGSVDTYFPPGWGSAGLATPAGATSPAVQVLRVAFHFRAYALNSEGTGPTDELVSESGFRRGLHAGLTGTTCRRIGLDPEGMPGLWVEFVAELVVVRGDPGAPLP